MGVPIRVGANNPGNGDSPQSDALLVGEGLRILEEETVAVPRALELFRNDAGERWSHDGSSLRPFQKSSNIQVELKNKYQILDYNIEPTVSTPPGYSCFTLSITARSVKSGH